LTMTAYAAAGVDVPAADGGIGRMVPHLRRTWSGGAVAMDIGYFANVVSIGGGIGVASTIDGVGSKTEVARAMDKWDTVGIDCVAANANDLICVGARPISMVDYVGTEVVDPRILEGIAVGLMRGAFEAGVAVVGGEVSQLPGMLRGLDLVGAAVGTVHLDRVMTGARVVPGDAVIGLTSSGVHCNGMTLARRHLRDLGKRSLELGCTVGEELLLPTRVYVRAVMEALARLPVHAAVNVTGDGLLNLNRVAADGVEFLLDDLPPPPPVFDLIRREGRLDGATMFGTFNMGVGFCLVVPNTCADRALRLLRAHWPARVIGEVRRGAGRSVRLARERLVGRGKAFAAA
jgi:phosphoribosylformylglycinamidine cyclo-ligase